jgi:hypothetical protein
VDTAADGAMVSSRQTLMMGNSKNASLNALQALQRQRQHNAGLLSN